MIIKFHPFLPFVFCLFGFNCNPTKTESLSARVHIEQLPTREELMNNFRQSRKVLIVYASQNPEMVAAYAELAKKINLRARYATFEIKPCSEVRAEDWETKALVVLGAVQSNIILQKLVDQLPLRLQKDQIVFDNKSYVHSIAMLSFYPNPLQPKLPLSVVTAHEDADLIAFLQQKIEYGWRVIGGSAWNYEIYRQGKRILIGMFNPENWTMDKKIHYDFSDTETPIAENTHFRFFANSKAITPSAAQSFAKKIEQSTTQILQFIGKQTTLPIFNYHLYASAEEKGLILNNSTQAHADFKKQEVHSVLNALYENNLVGKENELIARNLLGTPHVLALERGLATRFTPNWQFKGYEYWAVRLFVSDNMLSLNDLLNNELFNQESSLVTACLSATFVDFLIEHWGKEAFLQNYTAWQAKDAEIAALEKGWHTYLSKKTAHFQFEKWAKSKLPYLQGFNFAHEGYAIYNGYLSKLATQSIEKQADELSCSAIAIVPYSFMEQPDKPSFLPIEHGAGGENDEGVIHSARTAREKGMAVMLKPQLWMGRGYWPGDVTMNNDTDWQLFFDYYHRWMRHYALLAEIWQMDMLCIGTEFAKTTKVREQDWRALVKKLRGLYSGKMTYAANWGAEFEHFPFWDALDYIGVDCYYPLSNDANASKEALNAGFVKVLEKLEKVQQQADKPLIFTEIGFKSVKTPWLAPHAPSDNTPYFGEHQKMCYEIVMQNIDQKPWIKGIFWWKFPSYLEYRGPENDDFTPNRKPAEAVVKQWFGKNKTKQSPYSH